ncbi:MAG: hypothetical protein Q4P11_00340 [Methanobrevibacter sp.]|nr:hypothetical protein [Methanobrevibacter sp.]
MNLPTTIENNVVDVDHALKEWRAYQRLCKELLDDSDYQEYTQKDKKTGKIITKRSPKKSAWFKLGRAFNVRTKIVEKEFTLTKTGATQEAYYIIRAELPNGRTVESDGSCSRLEKGKKEATSHTIRSTAKTRATNRAIGELIGAGEVSAEELDPSFNNVNVIEAEAEEIVESAYDTSFSTAKELKEKEKAEAKDGEEDQDKVYRTIGDVITYATRLSKNNNPGNILKVINKLHAPLDLKQGAREQLLQNSIMINKYDTKLTCAHIFSIIKHRLELDDCEKKPSIAMKVLNGYNKKGLCDAETCKKVASYIMTLKLNDNGEFL